MSVFCSIKFSPHQAFIHLRNPFLADPKGNLTTYTYDAMSRVSSRQAPLLATETFTYDRSKPLTKLDGKGQLSRITGTTNAAYQYDAMESRIKARIKGARFKLLKPQLNCSFRTAISYLP